MRYSGRRVLAGAAGVALALTASGLTGAETPLTYDNFVKWIEDQSSLHQPYPPIDGLHLWYFQQGHHRVDMDEIARLRLAVAGRPDHPSRIRLQRLEDQLSGTPVERRRVWSDGPGRWRYSIETLDISGSVARYFDACMLKERAAWSFSGAVLCLFNPRGPMPPDRGIDSIEGSLLLQLGMFLHTGLARVHPVVDPGTFGVDGDQFTATVGSEGDLTRYRVKGRWDSREGRGFIIETINLGFLEGDTYKYEGWVFDPGLGLWRASAVDSFDRGGHPIARYWWGGAEALSEREFADLSAVPVAGKQDPIRGTVPTNLVTQDFRKWNPGADVGTVSSSVSTHASRQASPGWWTPWRMLVAAGALLLVVVFVQRVVLGRFGRSGAS